MNYTRGNYVQNNVHGDLLKGVIEDIVLRSEDNGTVAPVLHITVYWRNEEPVGPYPYETLAEGWEVIEPFPVPAYGGPELVDHTNQAPDPDQVQAQSEDSQLNPQSHSQEDEICKACGENHGPNPFTVEMMAVFDKLSASTNEDERGELLSKLGELFVSQTSPTDYRLPEEIHQMIFTIMELQAQCSSKIVSLGRLLARNIHNLREHQKVRSVMVMGIPLPRSESSSKKIPDKSN